MRQQSKLSLLAIILSTLTVAPAFAADVRVRDRNTRQNVPLDVNSTPVGKLPILFVHGHNLEIGSTEANDPNFQKNWQTSVNNLPPIALSPSLGIAVDTIGIGAGQSFVALLNDIAAATGGLALQTTAMTNLRGRRSSLYGKCWCCAESLCVEA